MFALVVGAQFDTLKVKISLFGVGLGMHRHILARSHRHSARDEAGEASDHDASGCSMRCRDT
jgi:hypothetical protein